MKSSMSLCDYIPVTSSLPSSLSSSFEISISLMPSIPGVLGPKSTAVSTVINTSGRLCSSSDDDRAGSSLAAAGLRMNSVDVV